MSLQPFYTHKRFFLRDSCFPAELFMAYVHNILSHSLLQKKKHGNGKKKEKGEGRWKTGKSWRLFLSRCLLYSSICKIKKTLHTHASICSEKKFFRSTYITLHPDVLVGWLVMVKRSKRLTTPRGQPCLLVYIGITYIVLWITNDDDDGLELWFRRTGYSYMKKKVVMSPHCMTTVLQITKQI